MASKKAKMFSNNHTYEQTKGEINNSPSVTVPDQVLSLRTLLDRSTTGQGIPTLSGYYEGERRSVREMLDNPVIMESMDIIEQIEYARNVAKSAHQTFDKIQLEKDASLQEAAKAKAKAEEAPKEEPKDEPKET